MKFQVKEAKVDLAHELCILGEEYSEESDWGYEFDYEHCYNKILDSFLYQGQHYFVVELDGEIVGGASVFYRQEFTLEIVGYIATFYIKKPFRGTHAPRELIKTLIEFFKSKECQLIYAYSAAHIGKGSINIFNNFLKKYGFNPFGIMLLKRL